MMHPIVKKLQYKLQSLVLVFHAPEAFAEVMKALETTAEVHKEPRKGTRYHFVIAFVQTAAEVQRTAKAMVKCLEPDAILWMTYPKKTSKKYKAEITRDNGWEAMGELGYEPVSLVSVDEDWSALRFRKVDYIKTMTRRAAMTLSKEGRKKTTGKSL
jgi:hypothetical protein